MNRLFLVTSFSGHVNYETGVVNLDHKQQIEDMLSNLRKIGNLAVFCAVEHEGWIISGEAPEVGVQKDLAEIDKSNIVLALMPTGLVSAGLQYEMGYADAKGKTVLVATPVESELSYFNQGIVNLGRVTHITYEDSHSLAQQVIQAVT